MIWELWRFLVVVSLVSVLVCDAYTLVISDNIDQRITSVFRCMIEGGALLYLFRGGLPT